MLILEMGPPFQIKPGIFRRPIRGVPFTRIWFLWFAFAYCSLSLREYHDYVSSGAAQWFNS